jgi:hypothetical protein
LSECFLRERPLTQERLSEEVALVMGIEPMGSALSDDSDQPLANGSRSACD